MEVKPCGCAAEKSGTWKSIRPRSWLLKKIPWCLFLREGADMKTQELKYVTRRRAAVVLGVSEMELSRISSESGFGHREIAGEQEEMYFTYEELRQICMLAVHQVH